MERLFSCALPVSLVLLLCSSSSPAIAGEAEDIGQWPRTVLITNDDGIDDPGLIALARAFSGIAETYVVAPMGDCSGSSHFISVFSSHVLEVQERDLDEGIRAWAVDGYPGDCVLLALQGLMAGTPPDLVVSGLNNGPNLGFDWMASGTIGAARVAAVWGVPAIAVSGLEEGSPENAEAVASWVIELARSDLVRDLGDGRYITVSLPRTSPSEFRGVVAADRAGVLLDFTFYLMEELDPEDGTSEWALMPPVPIPPASDSSDASLVQEGYVVIVPMQADEVDHEMLSRMLREPGILSGLPEL